MNTPLVSIILPTYNAGKTLDKSLDSIASQEFKNFEVVIMDGVSSDNTLSIVKSYSTRIPLVLVCERDNGIYDAMNKGLKIAKGEWIYFLGADDRLFDETVLSCLTNHNFRDVDIVYGDSVWWPENVMEEGLWDHRQLLKRSINHQRIFYRRKLFRGLEYETRYTVAADYALNIHFFCDPFVTKKYINRTIAYYHSGGFTSQKVDENFLDDWKSILIKNFAPYLPKKEIYLRMGWYCWYNLRKKRYKKSAAIFSSVFFKTYSFSFLKHTLSQLGKVLTNPLYN